MRQTLPQKDAAKIKQKKSHITLEDLKYFMRSHWQFSVTLFGHRNMKINHENRLLTLKKTCLDSALWHWQPSGWDKDDKVGSPSMNRTWARRVNTLRPRKKNGQHFPDDIFKCIFLNEKYMNSDYKIHWSFLLRVHINHIPALVQIMAWRRPGDKPLSEAMIDGRRIYA